MLNKFKQAIENWLRKIVRDEVTAQVSCINTSLEAERTAFYNHIMAASGAINTALYRLYELSHIKEATELRNHIRELESGITQTWDLIKKIHPSLGKQ